MARTSTMFTALAALAAHLSQAHIILTSPKPYVFAVGPELLNPLKPDGSDFPCKMPAGTTELQIDGAPTDMVIGETQTATFQGTAVHGGGSCQFSLTSGFKPSKASKWSVIHSIEGGCPAKNQAGNLAGGQNPDSWPFVIPEGIEPGEYTFAWTWVNRIGGQPEFYMNCAPINVKAGRGGARRARRAASAMSKRQEAFPDIFVANIGSSGDQCTTTNNGLALKYPHPGASVEKHETEFNTPTCDPRNGGSSGVDDSDDSDNSDNDEGNSPVVPPAPTPTTLTPKPSPPTVEQPAAPTPTETADGPEGDSTTPPPNNNVNNDDDEEEVDEDEDEEETPAPVTPAPETPAGDCTSGQLRCNEGEATFSICSWGKWLEPQALAPGTKCRGAGVAAANLDIYNPSLQS